MSHPSEELLVDLALGEVADAELAQHVAGCGSCSDTVAELRRTAALASTPGSYAGWEPPADEVWARVTADIDADIHADLAADLAAGSDVAPGLEARTDPDVTAGPVPASEPRPGAGPDAVVVPQQQVVPLRRPGPGSRSERASRRRTAGWAAALVAASLVVGLLAGRAIWSPDNEGKVAEVALSTLDTRQREGEATLVRAPGGLDLRVATDRPLDAGNGYLEVWLLNADGKRMVSVGVLQPGQSASFPIPESLLKEGYVIVDISKEQFDDKPAHSGDSLLRGQLPA